MDDSMSFQLEEFLQVPGTHEFTVKIANHANAVGYNTQDICTQPVAFSKQSNIPYPSKEEMTNGSAEYTHWSRNVTLRLIEEYKENHKKVGVSLRNFKKLFEMIAAILNKTFGLNLTGAQVNNKFKTLERGYKNVIDNNNKTGRGRKFFEYEKEMDSIFRKQTKINPEILLSDSTIAKIPTSLQQGTPESSPWGSKNPLQKTSIDVVNINDKGNVEYEHHEETTTNNENSNQPARKTRKKKTRNDILELIRQDRREYQEKQISTASERLAVETEKFKERKRRNDLLEERNQLLRAYIEKFVSN